MPVLNSSKPWTASISASGQIRLETSSLSAGYMISKSSQSKVRAAEWEGASGPCVVGNFERRNGSVTTVDGLACVTTASPHMLSGDRYTYVDNDAVMEAFTYCVYGFGACLSAALIPDFSCTMWSQQSHWLLDSVPDEQPDLSCPWNSWRSVIYSAVDSFFHSMNFNNFFSPLCSSTESFALCLCTAGYYSSYYLLEHQSPHVLWRNKAVTHSQRWKQRRECHFPPIGSEDSFIPAGED